MAFDDPAAIGTIGSELRHIHRGAIDERPMVGDANDATPRPLADERTQSRLAEPVRKDVAVGSRVLVENAGHMAVKHRRRVRIGIVIGAREPRAEQPPTQPFDHHL